MTGLCSSKPSMWQTMRLALKSKRTGYFLDRTFVWHQLVPGHDVCIVSLYAVFEGLPETKTIPITFSHLEDAGNIVCFESLAPSGTNSLCSMLFIT